MAGPLGKLTVVLGLDAREFQTGLANANKSVGGFGSTAAAGFKLASGAAALGFGLMTKGALEMERAQGNFMAATGASREEAVAFSRDMNELVGSAGAVGLSFDQIAETGTMVAQQFGVSGEAAQDLTSNILAFSKVTGQDAVGAAQQLEDTLTAYGLTADDAAGFMDQLVASNQTFGTDVGPEALGIFQKMAPAIQAMGGNLDTTLGLLNAFEVAGVDAASAQKGLNSAIEKLPPGTTIDQFLQHLIDLRNQGIDPTSEAIDVFGPKAGAGLALAIKPGMTSLDDLALSAEGAAGAVETASENMLTTGDRIKQFAEKAGAALRGLGQDFGPLLSGMGGLATAAGALPSTVTKPLTDGLKRIWGRVAGSTVVKTAARLAGVAASAAYSGAMFVGEKITTALSGMWSSVANSTRVKGAIDSAGRSMGGKLGTALKGAAVIGLIAMLPELWGNMQEEWAKITANKQMVEGSKNAFLATLPSREEVQAKIDELEKLRPIQLLDPFGDVGRVIDAQIADMRGYMDSGLADVGASGADALGTSLTTGVQGIGHDAAMALANDFAASTNPLVRAFGQAALGAAGALDVLPPAAGDIGAKTAQELAQGFDSGQQSAKDIWDNYLENMKNGLDPMKEIAFIEGKLSSQKVADGLRSNDPITRARTEGLVNILSGKLNDLQGLGYDIGAATGGNLTAQIVQTPTGPVVRWVSSVEGALDTLPPDATQVGNSSGNNLVQQIVQTPTGPVVRWVNGVNNILDDIQQRIEIRWNLQPGQRPGQRDKNPYRDRDQPGPGRQHGGLVNPLTAPYLVGEAGAELFWPKSAGMILSHTALRRLRNEAEGLLRIFRQFSHQRMPTFAAQRRPMMPAFAYAGGEGGVHVTVNVQNLYGGPSGLDQLTRDIQSRLRQTTRGGGRLKGSI